MFFFLKFSLSSQIKKQIPTALENNIQIIVKALFFYKEIKFSCFLCLTESKKKQLNNIGLNQF